MSKAKTALRENCAISHGLELYSYFISKATRKNIEIFEFENSFVSKYKSYKDFKLLEKNLKDDKPLAKKKKVAKLL